MALKNWLEMFRLRVNRSQRRQSIRKRIDETRIRDLSRIVEDLESRVVLAVVTLSGGGSVTEGNSGTTPQTYTVSLSAASSTSVTVPWSVTGTGSSPTNSSDFAMASGSVTIPPGMTSAMFTVSIKGDTTVEANETFNVSLGPPTGATLGTPSMQTGTIVNDDTGTGPTVTVSAGGNVTEGNAFTFTVSANGPIGQYDQIMVYWQLEQPTGYQYTATFGVDVSPTTGGVTLTSSNPTATVPIPTVGDNYDEYDEAFRVRFTSILTSNAMPGPPQDLGTRDVVIIDNDAEPVLTLKRVDPYGQTGSGGVPYDNTVPEADGAARFNAYLDHGSQKQIILTSGTTSGTAIGVPLAAFNTTANDTDFELFSGRTQTFNSYVGGTFLYGNTPVGMISIPVNNDWWDEPLETFTLNISATNVTVSAPQTTVSINDDVDDKPYVFVPPTQSVVEDNINDLVVPVQLSNPSLATVTIAYATADSTIYSSKATPVEDYTSTAGTVTFLPGDTAESVTIEIIDDDLWPPANDPWIEPEWFEVDLSNPVNSRLYPAPYGDRDHVSIVDERTFPFPNVSGPTTVLEGDPIPIDFTVTLPTTFEKTEVLNWKVYRDSSHPDYWEWNGGVQVEGGCSCICGPFEDDWVAPTPWGALLDGGSFTITPAGAKTFPITTFAPAANGLRDPDRVFRLRLEWENENYQMYNLNYDTPLQDDVVDPRVTSLAFDSYLLYENTNDAPPAPPVAYDATLGTVTIEYGWSIPRQVNLSIDSIASTATAPDIVMPSSVTIAPRSTTETFWLETVHDDPILSQPEGNETLTVVATPDWMVPFKAAPAVTIIDTLAPNYYEYIVPRGSRFEVPSDRIVGELIGDLDVRDSRYGSSGGGPQLVSTNGPFVLAEHGNIIFVGPQTLIAGSVYSLVVRTAVDEFGRSEQRTFQIEIIPGNQAPVFVGDLNLEVSEGSMSPTYVGTVTANDPNGDQVRYWLFDPTGLLPFTVDSQSGRVSTTTGFSATAGTTFTLNVLASDRPASDPRIRTSMQAITVYVEPFDVGDPVVGNDFIEVEHGGSIDIDVLANDFDPDSGPLSQLAIVDAPLSGTAAIIGDGVTEPFRIHFAAGSGSRGYETFTYSIRDADGNTSIGVVTVAVGFTFGGIRRVLFEYNSDNAHSFNPFLVGAGWTTALVDLKARGYQWDTVPEITEELLLGSDVAVDFGKGEHKKGILFVASQPGALDYQYSVSFDGQYQNTYWWETGETTSSYDSLFLPSGQQPGVNDVGGMPVIIGGDARQLEGDWGNEVPLRLNMPPNVLVTFDALTGCDVVDAIPVVAVSRDDEPRAMFSGSVSLFSSEAMTRPWYLEGENTNIELWRNTIDWLVDGAILVSVQDAGVVEGGDLAFTVRLSQPSSQAVTVNFATSNGSAESGADYLASSGSVTFAPNETEKTIQIFTLNDAVDENIEFLHLVLTFANNARIARGTGMGTITDDDPQPSVSISDVSVNEGGDLVFTVSLSAASGRPLVSVNYATSNETAAAGSDYPASSASVTFLEGETSNIVTVPTTNDLSDEFDETLRVTLSNLVHLNAGDLVGIGTILDNDDPPTLSVSNASVSEGGDLVFTVSQSVASGKTVTVNYATSNGTALAGVDYTSANGTLTFNPGQNDLTITVPTTEEMQDEDDETLSLELSNATEASIGTGTGAGTILNDDIRSVSVDNVTVVEGSPLQFTLTLSASSDRTLAVDYATANGTAVAGATKDYLATNGSFVFLPGETTKTVTVTTLEDALDEAVEMLNVVLSNPVNLLITPGGGIGTIIDNDDPPSITISDTSVTEGGELVFTVTLTPVSGQTVTVDYATTNGTAIAGATNDYLSASGTVAFLEGETSKTITVTTLDDLSDEFTEDLTVALSNVVNATLADDTATGTIDDNDGPPTVSVNSVSVSEGGDLIFTVSLSVISGKTVTVNYATADGTALVNVDYTSATGTLTFNPGQNDLTITVPTLQDTLDEFDEILSLALSAPTNATLGTATGTGTILDNDNPPTVSIDNVTVTEGGVLVFTLTLSVLSGQDVSMDFATANGTAKSGLDYTAAVGTVTIPAGQLSQTVTVATLNDVLNEAAEMLTVSLSNGVYVTIGTPFGTGTINEDNDPKPVLTISDANVTEGGNLVFTLTLSTVSGRSVSVDYSTASGAATSGTDFNSASSTVTFAEGETSKTISVITIDDALDEFSEDLTVMLSNAPNADLQDDIGIGTIDDNDPLPTLSINNATQTEGVGNLVFTVTLSAASGKTVTVDYTTSNGTALAGSDFTGVGSPLTLTFTPGTSSRTITVNTLDDTDIEGMETFSVVLGAVNNATISNAIGIGTIIDDDPDIVVELDTGSGNFTEVAANSAVYFGRHLINTTGTVVTRTFRLKNLGDVLLDVSDISIVAGDIAAFSVTTVVNPNPISVNGGTGTFTVTLNTSDVGHFEATLAITTNDPDESPYLLTLTGDVYETQPEIVVEYFGGGEFQSGGIVEFGATYTGESLTKVFVVRNIGDDDLHLSIPNNLPPGYTIDLVDGISDGSGSETKTVFSTPGNNEATFIVTLTAAANGFFDQNLTLTSDDFDEGQFTLRLVGRVRDAGLVTIIDNRDGTYSNTGDAWPSLANVPTGAGYLNDYEYYPRSSSLSSFQDGTAEWEATGLAAGFYRVSATWLRVGQRQPENQYLDGFAQYEVFHGGAATPVLTASLNQRLDPDDLVASGAEWEDIGYVLVTNANDILQVVLTAPGSDSKQRVIADAVRFERLKPSDDILYLPGGRDTYLIDVRTNDVPNGNLDVRLADTNLTGLTAAESPKVWLVTEISGGGLSREVGTDVWKKTGGTSVTINPDGSQTVRFANPFAPDLSGFNYELGVDPSVVFAFSDVAPIVKDDSFTVSHGHALTFDVRANDNDPQGDRLFTTIQGVDKGHLIQIQPSVQRVIDNSRFAIQVKNQTAWSLTLDFGTGPQTVSIAAQSNHDAVETAIMSLPNLPAGVTVEALTKKGDAQSDDVLFAVQLIGLPAGTTTTATVTSSSSDPLDTTLFDRGLLTTSADGTHTYEPNKTFFRAFGDYTETFRYVARDAETGGNPSPNPALAKIRVKNEAPYVSTPDKVRLLYEDGAPNLYRVGLGAFDADGDALTYVSLSSAAASPLSYDLAADGSIIFRALSAGFSGINNGEITYRIFDGHALSREFTAALTVWDLDLANDRIDGPIAGTFAQDPFSPDGYGWGLSGFAVEDRREASAYESLGFAVVDLNSGTFRVAQGLDVDLRQTTTSDGQFALTYNSQSSDRQPLIHTQINSPNSDYELDTAQQVSVHLTWYKADSSSRNQLGSAYGGTDQVFAPNTLPAQRETYSFTSLTGLEAGKSLAENLGNGVYTWEVDVTLTLKPKSGTGSSITTTLKTFGEVLLTDDDGSAGNPFAGWGNGWGMGGLPSLWIDRNQYLPQSPWANDTAILIDPAGEERLFDGPNGALDTDPWSAVVPGYRTLLPKELGTLNYSSSTTDYAYVAADETRFVFAPASGFATEQTFFARLIEIDPVAGPSTTFSYLPNGQIQTITSADGSVTTFAYSGGNLSTIQMPGNRTLTVAVSPGTGPNSATLDTFAIGNFVRAFSYDANNRLESDISGTGANSVETHFGYDAAGLLSSVTLGSPTSDQSTYLIRPASLYMPDSSVNQLPTNFANSDFLVGELVVPTSDLQKYDSTSGTAQSLNYGLRKYYFFDAIGHRVQESLYATSLVTPPTITKKDKKDKRGQVCFIGLPLDRVVVSKLSRTTLLLIQRSSPNGTPR